ncbi:MAG: hypothetical protein ACLTE2_05240 [Eubacteriales bacterium]
MLAGQQSKRAIKVLPQELLALVEQLEEDDTIRYCPHGRPVKVVIKKDLENSLVVFMMFSISLFFFIMIW